MLLLDSSLMKVEISCKFSQRKDIFLASVIKSLKQLLYAGYTQKEVTMVISPLCLMLVS